MTRRCTAWPICSLKFVTLLVLLNAEFLSLGARVQLQDNGYEGLLIAINNQVSEDQNLIQNIKASVIVTDWSGTHGDDPYTLQYQGCGKEGKYIHFTSNFLLDDDLTAGYGSRGRVFAHEWAHLRWGVFDEYNNEKPFYINGKNQIKPTRCSSDVTGVFVCEEGPCPQENCIISKLFKEGCMFIYNSTQNATASIMFMQSLSSVVEFCNASTHNREAPNLQNQICSLRSTWDVITDSSDFSQSFPLNGTELPPPPTFSLMQAGDKVVCLVLDVSSKMAEADRFLRMQQAAEFYLMQIVEIHTYVGIVIFNSRGEIRAPLHQINSDDDRKQLVSYLPTIVSTEAETSICSGLKKGFEVVEKLNGKAHGSVMILMTSGDDEHIGNCLHTVLSSASTIHSIALGSSVVENLEELAQLTGGLKFFVSDKSNSNSLIDVFSRISSATEDIFQQRIQLENTGENIKPHHQLKNTVSVDSGVGNDTTFLVTWQMGDPPEVVLSDPNGRKYYTSDFITNLPLHTAFLWLPGTAKPGLWTYTLNNTHLTSQSLTVTVSSRASHSAKPPATVEAFVERDSTHFPHPVKIYAAVRKGFHPLLHATVTATIQPETADPVMLRLFDNGAGADIIKNDGIYSRYFFSFTENGRYSLKVHVNHSSGISNLANYVPGSHAMYIPGYIENGNIQMNAPQKSVGMSEEEQMWEIDRVSSGGSFTVRGVPGGPYPDVFPPCKIIDLEAIRVEDDVTLSWTAPGEDFDQGKANSYEVRMSKNLQNIRDNFNSGILVNTSKLNPQQAGTKEIFTFSPDLFTNEPEHHPDGEIQDHRVYVAIRAIDKNSLKSAVSNIAQLSLFIPLKPATVFAKDHLILEGILIAMGLIGIICVSIVVIHCILNRKKRAEKSENGTKLL